MAKSLAKSVICGACGAEVRKGSLFCYKCGSEVAVEPLPPAILKPTSGILNGRADRGETETTVSEPEPPTVMVPAEPMEHLSRPPEALSSGGEELEGEVAPKTRLERVRANKRVQKVVEVEWVEHQGSNVWYILTAIVMAVVAGLMVAAALYLR